MKTCKTCEFRSKQGFCDSPKLSEDINTKSEAEEKDMLIYSYYEGGNFWVGEDFGCVHHKKVKK